MTQHAPQIYIYNMCQWNQQKTYRIFCFSLSFKSHIHTHIFWIGLSSGLDSMSVWSGKIPLRSLETFFALSCGTVWQTVLHPQSEMISICMPSLYSDILLLERLDMRASFISESSKCGLFIFFLKTTANLLNYHSLSLGYWGWI